MLKHALQWLTSEQTTPTEGEGTQTLPWERQRRSWDVQDELLTSLARQGCGAKPTTGRSADTPLPFDERTSNACRQLDRAIDTAINAIRDWQRDVIAPNPAMWLSQRIDRIRSAERAAQVVDLLDAAVRNAMAAIDPHTPPDETSADDPRLEQLDDQHATRREILDAIPAYTGHRITPQRFTMWVTRGKLTPNEHGRYRVGDVLQLARGTRP